MAWQFPWEEAIRLPASVKPDEVLYFYDEPLLFVSNMGFFDAICSKVDDSGQSSLLLISPTDAKTVSALKKGDISVRGALSSENHWLAEVGYDDRVLKAWSLTDVDLPDAYLPKKSYGLYPEFGRVPDTIEQATAFFSMKFSGSELHSGHMPFQTFKDLINSAFSATKALMTPHLLSGYKSVDVFSMPIAQPKFSSLAISIMPPEMDIGVINSRYARKNTTYSRGDIVRATASRRDEFFEKGEELVEEARKGEINDAFAQERIDWLKVVLEISPNPLKGVEDVEFTARTGKGRAYLHIDGDAGEKIRRAYDKAASAPRVMEGVVVEVNGDSCTFLVRNLVNHRQVTCSLIEDTFRRLDREGVLERGVRLKLRGNFEARVRRDMLHLTADPEVLS